MKKNLINIVFIFCLSTIYSQDPSQGFQLAQLTSIERIDMSNNFNVGIGKMVYDISTKSIWIYDGIEWLEQGTKNYLFNAYSSNLISNFSNGEISFSEIVDPNNNYNNTEYSAPIDGYYFFSTNISFEGGNGTDDTYFMNFLKNGVSANLLNINPQFLSRPGKEVNISNETILYLNAGNTVSVSLTSVDVLNVDYRFRNFMGYFVGK